MKSFRRSNKNINEYFNGCALHSIQYQNQAQSSYAKTLNLDESEGIEISIEPQIPESPTRQIKVQSKNVFNQYEKFDSTSKCQNMSAEIAVKIQQQIQAQIIGNEDKKNRKISQQVEQNVAYQSVFFQEQKQHQKYPDQQNKFHQQIINQSQKTTKRKLLQTQNEAQIQSFGSQILFNENLRQKNQKNPEVSQDEKQESEQQNKSADKYLASTQPYSPNIFKKKIASNKYFSFATKQLNQGYQLKMLIKKTSKFMGWNVVYSAHFYSDDRYFMGAQRMSHSHMMTHHMSINPDNFLENSTEYLGKIKSNFLKNTINILSQGDKPKQSENDLSSLRQVLATVVFTNDNVYGASLPRNIKVYVLKSQFQYFSLEGYTEHGEINLQELYKYQSNKDKIHVFRNRRPIWKEQSKCFVLDFQGRIKLPSIKNFILQVDNPKSMRYTQQVMLFGKLQQDKYLLDISSPLSPRVAFGIILAVCSTS